MTTNEFIVKAKKIHGNKYDYSKVVYTKSKEKVCIICPKHGEFWQTPNSHLRGEGCKSCYFETVGRRCKKDFETFKKEMGEKYGDMYDFSKSIYVNNKTKILVVCKKHGEFWIRPNDLVSGYGCPKCGHEEQSKKLRIGLDEFIEKARLIHGDEYEYLEIGAKNGKSVVLAKCKEHGLFWQYTQHHLHGSRCPKCSRRQKRTREVFINEAKKIHGNKYDYSKVIYKTTDTRVCIICPKHGEFWQTPYNHLIRKCSCPSCNNSKLEDELAIKMDENKIKYERHKKFDWLNKQHLDFFLPQFNIGVECQGIQHFEPIDFFGGVDGLEYRKKMDTIKKKLCEDNGITLLYVLPTIIEKNETNVPCYQVEDLVKKIKKDETQEIK